MLTIHDRGIVIRRVLLRDLVAHPEDLPRTVSHRQWARSFGLDERGSYVVETAEGRRIWITLPDGQGVERAPAAQ